MALLTFALPFLYLFHRVFATRVLHTLLRGVSRDRLDFLGEEYFEYVLKPRLKPGPLEQLKRLMDTGTPVVLVSDGLDHVTRPLAAYLGVGRILADRLEFRDGHATGRLLGPVIPPRTLRGRLREQGRLDANEFAAQLGVSVAALTEAIVPAARCVTPETHPLVDFTAAQRTEPLSARKALSGKQILLIGGTGFIGKVWLANTLMNIPDVGKIHLLIRRQRSATGVRRFEKIVEESPIFDAFHERHGNNLGRFMRERVEVVEGDVSQPGLGLDQATRARLADCLDLIINSAGLTDFNPDLRTALAINVDGMVHLTGFVRECRHAALLHLSTCFVVGFRDGRVKEELVPNYTPIAASDFDAERERQSLHDLVRRIEQQAESPEVTNELRQQALKKSRANKALAEPSVDHQVRKNRLRWVRAQMVEAGMRRARELGWPNTYCFTKSLGESLLVKLSAGLPLAVVRPSITETSTHEPFRGWNEGVTTSAPLSYLSAGYFRQLPSNARKCLDVIPVDLVARGMTLIAAALVERRHEPLYQLGTSACNPCDMGRTIDLTNLAHRKHLRAQGGLENQIRLRFDTIPVSKRRFRTFSAPGQKAMIRALRRLSSPIPFAYSSLVRKERDLERVEKLIELYEPFILHNEYTFEALNVEMLSALLPPDEQATFGYDAHALDWWDYWINIHIPALRRWTYPLIEGRPLEARTARPFSLDVRSEGAAN